MTLSAQLKPLLSEARNAVRVWGIFLRNFPEDDPSVIARKNSVIEVTQKIYVLLKARIDKIKRDVCLAHGVHGSDDGTVVYYFLNDHHLLVNFARMVSEESCEDAPLRRKIYACQDIAMQVNAFLAHESVPLVVFIGVDDPKDE